MLRECLAADTYNYEINNNITENLLSQILIRMQTLGLIFKLIKGWTQHNTVMFVMQ
jgi:hypothetical protein